MTSRHKFWRCSRLNSCPTPLISPTATVASLTSAFVSNAKGKSSATTTGTKTPVLGATSFRPPPLTHRPHLYRSIKSSPHPHPNAESPPNCFPQISAQGFFTFFSFFTPTSTTGTNNNNNNTKPFSNHTAPHPHRQHATRRKRVWSSAELGTIATRWQDDPS